MDPNCLLPAMISGIEKSLPNGYRAEGFGHRPRTRPGAKPRPPWDLTGPWSVRLPPTPTRSGSGWLLAGCINAPSALGSEIRWPCTARRGSASIPCSTRRHWMNEVGPNTGRRMDYVPANILAGGQERVFGIYTDRGKKRCLSRGLPDIARMLRLGPRTRPGNGRTLRKCGMALGQI